MHPLVISASHALAPTSISVNPHDLPALPFNRFIVLIPAAYPSTAISLPPIYCASLLVGQYRVWPGNRGRTQPICRCRAEPVESCISGLRHGDGFTAGIDLCRRFEGVRSGDV